MTRQKKELEKKISEIYEWIEVDDALGCGFAPAGAYAELEQKAYEYEEELAHLRKYKDAMEMRFDTRWQTKAEMPFA